MLCNTDSSGQPFGFIHIYKNHLSTYLPDAQTVKSKFTFIYYDLIIVKMFIKLLLYNITMNYRSTSATFITCSI